MQTRQPESSAFEPMLPRAGEWSLSDRAATYLQSISRMVCREILQRAFQVPFWPQ